MATKIRANAKIIPNSICKKYGDIIIPKKLVFLLFKMQQICTKMCFSPISLKTVSKVTDIAPNGLDNICCFWTPGL